MPRIATASTDKTCKLWRCPELQLHRTLYGHVKALCDCVWAHDNTFVATASEDRTVKIWQVSAGVCVHDLCGHSGPVLCCDFNTTGTLVASASCDETIRLWDTCSGCCISVLPAHTDPVTSIHFSSDSTVLLSAGCDGVCRLWDIHSNSCLKSTKFEAPIGYASFTQKMTHIVVATLNRDIHLLDAKLHRIFLTKAFDSEETLNDSPYYTGHQCGLVLASSTTGAVSAWAMDRGRAGPIKLVAENELTPASRTVAAYNMRRGFLVTCSFSLKQLVLWKTELAPSSIICSRETGI